MSEIRQQVAYGDIVVGDDFNSRESFRVFVQKAYDVAEDGTSTLKSAAKLKKVLSDNENKILAQLQELTMSIESQGLLQPILVREGGPAKKGAKRRRYFLIAGERRYRAIGLIREKSNRFRQVEVKLKKCNAEGALLCNLLENLQREDLAPLEVAHNIEKIMALGKLTQTQAAVKIGKSDPYVSQHLALLRSAPEIQAAITEGVLTATHVREMATLPASKQKEILATVMEKAGKGQKASVLDVKEEADKHKEALGLKKNRGRKPKNKGPVYDREKVATAKELLGDHELNVRSTSVLLEMFATLHARLNNPSISDATRLKTKIQIAGVEWQLGVRETL
jgi:ParB/RepB/Spo0J family partition protein